jgi:hypothetical protein
MRILAGACLAALALAACSKPADQVETPAAGTPGKAAEAPIPPGIDAAPRLKAGLWEMTATIGGKPETLRICVDPAIQGDSAIPGQGLSRANCSKSDWTKMEGGVAFDTACANGGATLTSVGVITGDFETAYHYEADATMTQGGKSTTGRQVFDAAYKGECPAGLKPGERQRLVGGKFVTLPAQSAG